jgi:hypothetical protein
LAAAVSFVCDRRDGRRQKARQMIQDKAADERQGRQKKAADKTTQGRRQRKSTTVRGGWCERKTDLKEGAKIFKKKAYIRTYIVTYKRYVPESKPFCGFTKK